MANIFRAPLVVYKWSQDPNAWWRSWTWNYNLNLIGKDRLPVGKQVYDLPPRAADPYPRDLRTWTLSLVDIPGAPEAIPPGEQRTELTPLGAARLTPPVDLRSWDWSYNLNLIGQDALPVGSQIFGPVPARQARQPIEQTWIVNLQQTTLRPIPPGAQRYELAPFWSGFPRQIDLRTWVLNLQQTTLSATPFNQEDWPLPKAPAPIDQTWTRSFPLNLRGADFLLVGLQFYDLPPQPAYPVDLRFFAGRMPPAEVTVPFAQFDWPLPIARDFAVDLRTLTESFNLNLIGQDAMTTGERVFDLPPGAFAPTVERRSWTFSFNLNLIGRDDLTAGQQYTERPPLGPHYSISLRTWINPPLKPVPFNQEDWPLPKAPYYSIDLRTWTAAFPLSLVGQDAMTVGDKLTDRPPLAPIPPENIKSWIQSVNLALVTAPGVPFVETDWPLPGRAVAPERSFSQTFPPVLVGQDQLPTGKQVTDLPPRGISATDLRSWIWYTALTLSSPAQPIGIEVTELPPRAPQQPAQSFTQSFPQVLVGQDALPVGKQVTDLTPRGILATDYRSWISFTSLALNNSLGRPIGAKLFELAPRAAQRPANLDTWIDATKLLLRVPFSQADWPLPGRPLTPQRSWIDTLKLPLVTANQPFTQTDWPLPARPQTPERSFTFSFPRVLIGQDQLPPGRQVYDRTPPGFIYSQELRTLIAKPQPPQPVVVTAGGETLLMMGVG